MSTFRDAQSQAHPTKTNTLMLGVICVLILIVSIQIWLLTASMNESLAGDDKDAARAEYAVGYDLAQQTRSQLQMDEDAETSTPVKGVGRALAKWVNHAERRFSFQVYVAPDVNAFALPGGFIFLSRPIVQMCLGRQDELAFILGHEMAHVVRGHVLDRMIWGTLVNAASNAVRVAGPVAGVIRSAAATYVQRSYSRDQELEADILGVRLMRAAGFEPEGAVQIGRAHV